MLVNCFTQVIGESTSFMRIRKYSRVFIIYLSVWPVDHLENQLRCQFIYTL